MYSSLVKAEVADSALFGLIPVQNLMPKDIADPTTFWISLFCWQKQPPRLLTPGSVPFRTDSNRERFSGRIHPNQQLIIYDNYHHKRMPYGTGIFLSS